MGGGAVSLETTQLAAAVDESKPAAKRMLIYSARITMAVADIESCLAMVQKHADEMGGYMISMASDGITVRVPAKEFFGLLDRLKGLGQTLTKDINASDVTDEYVDLQLRLKNAEALRDRFLAILAQAKDVKDTLAVERELNRIREEIERIKGRLAMLSQQIRYSTVEVHFVQMKERHVRLRRPESPFPWLDRLGVETVLRIRQR